MSETPLDGGAPATAVATATMADVAAIVDLVNGAYRGDGSRAGWTTEADLLGGQRTDAAAVAALVGAPDGALLTLRAGESLMACVHLEKRPDALCYLGMLTVRPDLQRAGIGRRLLGAAEAFAQRRFAATRIEMTVIEARTELIDWYRRRGYAPTGETRPFPYGDARFGLPRREDLRFVVLRRALAGAAPASA
ncbi:MAG: GNAT family N-acetyltransferase [Gammaproteobacteria bacterium]|nr:GNAT family N-acetyltransferase [Gammaproteobacteria bacterium]